MGLQVSPLTRILVLLGLLFGCAHSAYDRNNRQTTENFDPAESNPEGQLYCIGTPEYKMPRFPGFDPNTMTMDKLCKKPQYGGNPRGKHVGGYCYGNGLVLFDNSPEAETHPGLSNPRFWVECMYRCFCDYSMWEDGNPASVAWAQDSTTADYFIKADLVNDFTIPPPSKTPHLGKFRVHRLRLAREVAIRQRQPPPETDPTTYNPFNGLTYPDLDTIVTTIDPANHVISCDNVLFPFEIPGPMPEELRTIPPSDQLRALCVNAMDGGLGSVMNPRHFGIQLFNAWHTNTSIQARSMLGDFVGRILSQMVPRKWILRKFSTRRGSSITQFYAFIPQSISA